ncbi:MAG: 2Fe-2S iron-sulfur cluster-binding protein [Anaerolineae bacterium]
MPDVSVTIDGISGSVPAGITVLEACRRLGIEVPTLCDHPAIEPIGACRICLVEIEKQRALQPACTFPVSDGMVVHTRSDKVVDARRFVLQLLFSERNHFCMFCQMSGSCTLQDLAYDYGLDHWEFDRAFPRLGVDASRAYFVMDHNRCILCRRCVRVCDELVGNATLGVKRRGADTMIIADMDVPFGESSCVSCGTCLQVCPTGALGDRASAYMGATDEISRVKSTCTGCSVGCGVELIVREGRVIRVEGDWDAPPSHGLLCEVGRFHLQHDKRLRVREPMVRDGESWGTVDWKEALAKVADGISASDGMCTLVSGLVTNEAAEAIVETLPGNKRQMGAVLLDESAGLEAMDEADMFVVIGTDLTVDHQVAGFAIKRGVRHRGARLVLVGDGENGLAPWAFKQVGLDEGASVLDIVSGAEAPMIVYDAAGASVARSMAEAVPKATCVCFTDGANTKGLAAAGIAEAFQADGADAYLVVAGELTAPSDEVMNALKAAKFVAVQASFVEPWSDVADVILPMPTMWEKGGTVTGADGVERKLQAAVKTEGLSEVAAIEQLGALLA